MGESPHPRKVGGRAVGGLAVPLSTPRRVAGSRFVDALPWTDSFAFEAFGVAVGVRCNDPDLRLRMEAALPPSRKAISRTEVDRIYSLRRCVERDVYPTQLFGRLAELSPSTEVEVAVEQRTPRGVLAAIASICPEVSGSIFRRDTEVDRSAFVLHSGIRLDDLDRALPTPEGGLYRLYRGGRLIAVSRELDEVMEALDEDLGLYLAAWSPSHLFLHAGVVSWRGRCIVLPGRSCAGKSTLVAALLRNGAQYHSDEFAPLDEGCRVASYPRPLRLRCHAGRRRVEAAEFGATIGCKPLPVGLVAFTEYEPGACWEPARLSSGDAALRLLCAAVSARRRRHDALRLTATLARSVPCLEGARGEATEAAEAILRQLDAR